MHQTVPQVSGGRLYQFVAGADPIVVGTPAWYDWLEHNQSFIFTDHHGVFTAHKRGIDPSNLTWNASRSHGGRLFHFSLGPSHMLTLQRLQSAAQELTGEHAPAEPNEVIPEQPAASQHSTSQTADRLGLPRSLLRTKLYRPPTSSDLIFRDRLIDRLNTGLSAKVTLVCTPAGFGKSTLLAQWVQTCERPAAWLSLDDNDNELAVFVHLLTSALCTIFPDICPETASLLIGQQSLPAEQVATLLLNELADLPTEVILVLDDYHLIRNSQVHDLLTFLVEHLPPSLHLVLASRTDPPLPLVRWRAKGLLQDLRGAELRFTHEETYAFLERVVGITLAQATSQALEEKTEGWIALLRLAALSLRNTSDPDAFLQRLESYPDRAISSYLVEEILAQQAPAVQDFLVRTSMLQQFCAELCAATLDSDAPYDQLQAILTWLEHANLFIIPLDERQGWYRYHPLIKQLLEQRLKEYSSSAAIARLHRRASAWYAGQGLIEEAIEHALSAGDAQGATQLVEARFLMAFEQEQWVQMERWLRLLPEEKIQSSPCLLFAQAWILQAHGRLNDLPRLFTAAEQLLAGNESGASNLNDSQSRFLHALLEVGWSLFQFFTGQAQESLVNACSALERALPDQEFIASHALFFLALANQAIGHEEVALLELNRGLREHSAHLHDTARLLFAQAIVYLAAGKLQQVEQTARHLLRLSQQSDLVLSQNWAHRFLGVVYYEWNNLDEAFYHFSAVIAKQHHAHFWVVRDAMWGQALIHQAQGLATKAQDTARSLCELLQEQQNIQELQTAYAFCGRLALLQNDLEAAKQWLEMAGEQGMLGPMMFFEDPPITQARLLLTKGDEQSVAQGQELLSHLLQHVEAMHNTRKIIKVLAMQAWAFDVQGRETEALEVLERALSLARPGGFIRTFADLPPLVKVLQELRKSRKAQQAVDKPLEAYLQRILVAMRPEAPPTNAEEALMQQEGLEPLTSRERQILRLLDRDLTNKEIARALVVTPGTVKVHTNSIYRKLCVNNRRAAITLSKALGLLVSDQISSPPAT